MSTVYVISGPPAVGKSTVSQLLSESLSSSALIHADEIYHMTVGGHLPPWKSEFQLNLLWDNVSSLTTNFIHSGFDVVIDAVAFPKDIEKLHRFIACDMLKYVILLSDEKTLMLRDANRSNKMGNRCIVVLREFLDSNPETGYLLYTDFKTPEQVVNAILQEKSFQYHA